MAIVAWGTPAASISTNCRPRLDPGGEPTTTAFHAQNDLSPDSKSDPDSPRRPQDPENGAESQEFKQEPTTRRSTPRSTTAPERDTGVARWCDLDSSSVGFARPDPCVAMIGLIFRPSSLRLLVNPFTMTSYRVDMTRAGDGCRTRHKRAESRSRARRIAIEVRPTTDRASGRTVASRSIVRQRRCG